MLPGIARLVGAAAAGAISLVLAGSAAALAQTKGIDTEKKIVTVGAFTPVTGPVPFYSVLTHAADAYYKHLNENGGIRGWKVNYITYDDGYDPARSVAVSRKLVEEDGAFALSA
ncbi:MAG: ABC transporter substrate-binding protein, partial [Alphaproteobacteria bacterium]